MRALGKSQVEVAVNFRPCGHVGKDNRWRSLERWQNETCRGTLWPSVSGKVLRDALALLAAKSRQAFAAFWDACFWGAWHMG